MTFPGVEGVKGPGWLSTTGFQVRQNRAGQYPGTQGATDVVHAMGPNAPAWAVTADAVTVEDEVAADPHPIEAENFEATPEEGGVDHFGADQAGGKFDDDAVPGYEGE